MTSQKSKEAEKDGREPPVVMDILAELPSSDLRFLRQQASRILDSSGDWRKIDFRPDAFDNLASSGRLKSHARSLRGGAKELVREALSDRILHHSQLFRASQKQASRILQSIWGLEHNSGGRLKGLLASTLLRGHLSSQFDVLSLVRSEATSKTGTNYFFFSDAFFEILPLIRPKPEALLDTLDTVRELADGDLAPDPSATGIVETCKAQPLLAKELFNRLTAPERPALAYLPAVLVGLSHHDLAGIHARALDLARSNGKAKNEAIASLGLLPYENDPSGDLLKESLDFLLEGASDANPLALSAISFAAARLCSTGSTDALELLERLSCESYPEVKQQVLLFLLRERDRYSSEKWYLDLLWSLAPVSSTERRIIERTAALLQHLAATQPLAVLLFLEFWLKSGPAEGDKNRLELNTHFPTTVRALLKNHYESFTEFLTLWFASQDSRLIRGAGAVAESVIRSGHDEPEPSFVSFHRGVLNGLAPPEVSRLIEVVLVFTREAGVQVTLLFSVLERTVIQDWLKEAITDALEWTGYNLPGATLPMLEETAASAHSLKAGVALNVLRRLRRYYDRRASLPKLRELRPPRNRLQVYNRAARKQARRIFKQSEEDSIFRTLATTVSLKVGRAVISEIEGRFDSPSLLAEISSQVEAPRAELIDPLGCAYRRHVVLSSLQESSEKQG